MSRIRWQAVEGSTVVSAAAYDEAAEKIHVKLRNGEIHAYLDCTIDTWTSFMATSTSKGEFLLNVLARRHEGGVQRVAATGAPRTVVLNAFRPAQEMADPTLFAGRNVQIKELADSLQMNGSVPLIYGDRGLGKSSLAAQGSLIAMGDVTLLDQMRMIDHAIPEDNPFLATTITCSDQVRDLDDLLQLMINSIEDVVPEQANRGKARRLVDRQSRKKVTLKVFEYETTKKYEAEKARVSYKKLSLIEQLLTLCGLLTDTFGCRILFVIDEVDRIHDKKGLASALKTMSSDDLKFALVGIAQDWSDLLLDHPSIERQVWPIRTPRMTRAELAEIIDRAEERLHQEGLSFTFADDARTKITRTSSGFPWFVHVIAQASLQSALDAGETVITKDMVTKATKNLVTNRFASHFADTYQRAIRDSLHREYVLRVFASWRTPDIPTASVYPVLKSLGVTNPAVYRGHLASEAYGSIFMTPGYQNRGLVRFRNEMFKQYVFMVPSLYRDVDSKVREAMKDA